MPATIRLAADADAAQMLAIYASFVRNSIVSFEIEVPSEQSFKERIARTLVGTPWLVCEIGGCVAGYVYALPHHQWGAYRWSLDTTVYVDPAHHRKGIAWALYSSLFACLRLQGYYNVYAGITLPNPASVGLHESLGFNLVGIYQAVGHKLGAWRDVGWWHLALVPYAATPTEPLVLRAAMDKAEWRAALEEGQGRLQP